MYNYNHHPHRKTQPMQYMVSTRSVATPAINIATPSPTDLLTDSIMWLPLWMIDETYDLTQLGAHVEIVLSIEDAEGGIRTTNRIYAAEPNVAAALTPFGFSYDDTTHTATRKATISHVLTALEKVDEATGIRWLNAQPDLHRIQLSEFFNTPQWANTLTTSWLINRNDDSDNGIYYDNTTNTWEIF